MKRWICLLAFIHVFVFSQNKKITVQKIITNSNQAAYYAGKDRRSKLKMYITNERGQVRERQLIVLRKNTEEQAQNYYMYFLRPADVRLMSFLTWKKPQTSDSRWLYMPALDTVKRIAPSNKRTSFVGSHFFHEDTSGRSIEDDFHKLVKITKEYFVFQNIPKRPQEVEFSFYISWIKRSNYLPVKAVYYNKNKKKYRLIQTLEVKNINGYPTATKQEAKDLIKGGKTIIVTEEVKYNVGVPAHVFRESSLKNPPKSWLK